jgi:hypothetical protein
MFSSLLFNLLISGDGIMFSSTNQRVWGEPSFLLVGSKLWLGAQELMWGVGWGIRAWDSC